MKNSGLILIRLKIPKHVLRCNAQTYSDEGIFDDSFLSFLNAILRRPFIQDGAL